MTFNNVQAVRKNFITRIHGSLNLYKGYADSVTKKITEDTIKNFSEGIENDTFGLQRLKPATIKQKQKKGYPSPETPLLGKGGTDKRSYKNMLIYRKLKSGFYRIRPSDRYHHKARVSLKTLFFVHEYGMVIDNGKALIFIPARPALGRAVKQTKYKVQKELIKKAIMKYWNKGINIFKGIK
jgi:hypothetical protein